MAQARRPPGAAGAETLRALGSAGERGGPGPARRAQCSCPEAGRRLRALSAGLIVARSRRGGGEAAGCSAPHSLLAAPPAGRGDGGAHLAGGAPRRLGPAGKPAPCAERTRAGLQLPGRPSSALPAPRCPRPVPARSPPCALCSLRPALLRSLARRKPSAECVPKHRQRSAFHSGTREETPTLSPAEVSNLKPEGMYYFPAPFGFHFRTLPINSKFLQKEGPVCFPAPLD